MYLLIRDGANMKPLEIAVKAGFTDIVELLLQHGISANVANAAGVRLWWNLFKNSLHNYLAELKLVTSCWHFKNM